jgi:hypothetical protein
VTQARRGAIHRARMSVSKSTKDAMNRAPASQCRTFGIFGNFLKAELHSVHMRTALAILVFLFPSCLLADQKSYQQILNMMSKEKSVRQDAVQNLLATKNVHLAPAMTDALFYIPRAFRGEMIGVLERITGHKAGSNYYDWVEYIGRRTDLKSPPGYIRFKVALFSLIDERYKRLLYPGVPLKIRAEEIVWGGVGLDGIPPIDIPRFISAEEANLQENEQVFAILWKGEARAYPLRYLSWHEMLNDRIAGEPITLSY